MSILREMKRLVTPGTDLFACRVLAAAAGLLLLLLLLLPISASVSRAACGPKRPNVVLLVSDDQRPDTIGALGNSVIRTPNLDRLARRGSVMTRAVCPNPICTPSRAEILSGCTGFYSGVTNFGGKFKPELLLWPEAMRRAGYRTWYCGKWHNDGRPTTRGYVKTQGLFAGGGRRFWKPSVDYRGHRVTGYVGWVFQTDDRRLLPELGVGLTPDTNRRIADAAIELLQQKGDAPFFLHVNFTAPHDPLLAPRDARHHYDPDTIPLPENFAPRHPFDHGNLNGRDEQLLPFPRTPDVVRADLAMYYSVISDLDAQVGRILDTLRTEGLADSTIVIYTSDHGLAIGSHGLRGKQNMYEHTIGVPLILAGPGVPANRRYTQQVYLRDLYPTVCELCNVRSPDYLEGRSFVPVYRDRSAVTYRYTVGYFRDVQRMIRTDRWKLIDYPRAGRRQLFDLKNDPLERRNLADDPAWTAQREELQSMLTSWQTRHHDPLVETAAP